MYCCVYSCSFSKFGEGIRIFKSLVLHVDLVYIIFPFLRLMLIYMKEKRMSSMRMGTNEVKLIYNLESFTSVTSWKVHSFAVKNLISIHACIKFSATFWLTKKTNCRLRFIVQLLDPEWLKIPQEQPFAWKNFWCM